MSTLIPVRNPKELVNVQKDLLKIYQSNMYINEKGYLQKLVDLLYKLGYYEDNESIFILRKDK